jgi:hypothetical protein
MYQYWKLCTTLAFYGFKEFSVTTSGLCKTQYGHSVYSHDHLNENWLHQKPEFWLNSLLHFNYFASFSRKSLQNMKRSCFP